MKEIRMTKLTTMYDKIVDVIVQNIDFLHQSYPYRDIEKMFENYYDRLFDKNKTEEAIMPYRTIMDVHKKWHHPSLLTISRLLDLTELTVPTNQKLTKAEKKSLDRLRACVIQRTNWLIDKYGLKETVEKTGIARQTLIGLRYWVNPWNKTIYKILTKLDDAIEKEPKVVYIA